LTLHDISSEGRALVSRDTMRSGAIGRAPGEQNERDLSWQDWSVPVDLSSDGRTMLFIEAGEAGGGDYAVFLRGTNGTPAVLLGKGSGRALSPDGNWVLALRQDASPPDFVLLPTGVGQQRALTVPGIIPSNGFFLPDSKHVVFGGHEPNKGARLYQVELSGGSARAISPEGLSLAGPHALSPDGKVLAALSNSRIVLQPVDGGEFRIVPGTKPGETPVRWTDDGKSLLVALRGPTQTELYRVDVVSGSRTLVHSFKPADSAGVNYVSAPSLSADQNSYVFGYSRVLSDLFIVDQLR
jgi:eukaryotic-like serine/threonine-protein kinase